MVLAFVYLFIYIFDVSDTHEPYTYTQTECDVSWAKVFGLRLMMTDECLAELCRLALSDLNVFLFTSKYNLDDSYHFLAHQRN